MIDRKTINHEHLLVQFTTEQGKVVKAVEEAQNAFDKALKDISERVNLEAVERREMRNQEDGYHISSQSSPAPS